MNTSWKTSLGGAFSALGKTMMGVGIIPQLAGLPSRWLSLIALLGFIFDGIGSFFGHLFAADAAQVDRLTEQVALQETAIRTGDTSILRSNNPIAGLTPHGDTPKP